MKTVWITALSRDSKQVDTIISKLGSYGLSASGHFWTDDLQKQAWTAARDKAAEADLWLILTTEEELAKPSVRYGLSLVALSIQGAKGQRFPIFIGHDGEPPAVDTLPTPLRGAALHKVTDPVMPAKLVGKANVPVRKSAAEYRLQIHALPVGVCFEVGPTEGQWSGALFGVACGDGDLGAMAPGTVGEMPQSATLEFPIREIKLELDQQEFSASAVKNAVDTEHSIFAQVQGEASAVMFGPFGYDDDEVSAFYILRLI